MAYKYTTVNRWGFTSTLDDNGNDIQLTDSNTDISAEIFRADRRQGTGDISGHIDIWDISINQNYFKHVDNVTFKRFNNTYDIPVAALNLASFWDNVNVYSDFSNTLSIQVENVTAADNSGKILWTSIPTKMHGPSVINFADNTNAEHNVEPDGPIPAPRSLF